MVDVVGVQQLADERALFRRGPDGLKQAGQGTPVAGSGQFLQGPGQGLVAQAGGIRQARGIGGQESEGIIRVLAVFSQVEADPADLPPEGGAFPQQRFQSSDRLGLGAHVGIQCGPQPLQGFGAEVFAPRHRRGGQQQLRCFRAGQRQHGLQVTAVIRSEAAQVQIAGRQLPPPGRARRQAAAGRTGRQLEQASRLPVLEGCQDGRERAVSRRFAFGEQVPRGGQPQGGGSGKWDGHGPGL